ncbi:HAE1 family hydrophobic/amphiphilic exporter-1 [Anseongella ginsenosidimutans]|uniref:HAE1 family hydrophobic/amphiphilic exporter-1 n=1 Tax=Anseongella ginsenosidimutans TaxID=496056 RepID=A0A4R3KU61_9SPHI|nr:efflux RND transporter permease subunit [Anseongella ginsenosidimutans]QEC51582.1 efflux RND transporter permease subunit [Anseongella ginsenosidimutans]TCS88909.1 HAE1 family hydrophobic/amphiphilic exporter-1 [Anseongella ginsenosidimutans]
MLKQFIDRPVLSTVVSIIILILGVLGLTTLPVTQYPDIAPPTVRVQANYPGANAETVLESVIIPIEEQINGVEGMTYITSTASNSGMASIQVFFEQGIDPDIAAVNVQNRVARAAPLLPREVTQSGVSTQKQQTSSLMFLTVLSENEDYDATYIQNYLNINVLPALKRINGVGDVQVFGAKNYAMRIWLLPEKLAAYDLMPADVTAAINEQSLEAAAGSLGQNNAEAFEYVIKYGGRFSTEDEYEGIIIKALGNGQFLRLKDVARVELDAEGYSVVSHSNGLPGVSMGINQTPGSNAQEIIENIHAQLDVLEKDFPPGMSVVVNFDTNEFLTASIDKVVVTLLEAFVLVFIVVFIFLQDFRSTLIPAIAVPVSIVGTFFFLGLFGYSVNLLTLFALVLAIGIVVDDAIVVVEAVHAKLEEGAESGRKATHSAMSEITGAIISITLVMGAVFIPVTFITGPTGVFYEQFGVTLIVAIAISALNALTLSPALCALFLKPHKDEHGKKKSLLKRFYSAFNTGFEATTRKYVSSLRFLFRHKWITAVILLAAVAGIVWSSSTTPTGFVPNEDRGIIFTNVELPAGASLDRTVEVTQELYRKLEQIPGVAGGTLVNGYSLISGAGSNYALGFIKLDPWEDRKADSLSADAITAKMFGAGATMSDANVLFFAPPSVPGFGVSSGFELNVLDRLGGEFTELDRVTKEYLGQLMQRPEILYAQSSFNTSYPQYEIELNVPKAKEAGVSISSIFGTLQGYIGSIYAADFARFGKQYRVYVQSLPEDRANTDDLNKLFVRNSAGEMAPITEFVSLKRVYGPQAVTRFNLFNSAGVNGAAAPGYSTGDAIKAVQEVSATALPANYSVAFSGLTREEISAGNQTLFIIILSVLFVYFILAAQYESYLIPFSVLLSLPIGIMGAFVTTKFAGLEVNIYFQIALIMLLGLLAKNAILIVEFAIQRRKAGLSIAEAAFEGARVRLRPILMTSFAFIVGLLPLVFAGGIGAEGNNSIGTGAVGGLLIGTVFGVFVIPILYILFQWLQEKISGKPQPTDN